MTNKKMDNHHRLKSFSLARIGQQQQLLIFPAVHCIDRLQLHVQLSAPVAEAEAGECLAWWPHRASASATVWPGRPSARRESAVLLLLWLLLLLYAATGPVTQSSFSPLSLFLRCCSVSVAFSAALVGDRKSLKKSALAGRSRTDEPLSAAGKDEKKIELEKVNRESGRGGCAS